MLQNVSITVEVRHRVNKTVIVRSERFVKLSPASNESLQVDERTSDTRIVYKAWIECDKFYYGPGCAKFCQANDANFHFYCSSEGERLCENGWSGPNCDDPVCPNGCGNGTCIAPGVCRCRRGWQGVTCSQCQVLEGCKHGYCADANQCICEKNWGGTFCDRLDIVGYSLCDNSCYLIRLFQLLRSVTTFFTVWQSMK
ncbi:unnamed protein product [Anisakis simplex]|uniref:Delta-like protein n=1 Tax=Anisakis simplex TaxID=6269 RepID=A0A0M3KH13_ANISI|nr:unnamed protein product [Anisakis simplex]